MIDDLIDILNRSRRECSLAEVVSGPPVDVGPTSCMSGGFYGTMGEAWPATDHGSMIPLIQIVIGQLPVVPACLQHFALVNVFVERINLPRDGHAPNGKGWLLRAYERSDELVPMRSPSDLWAGEYPKGRRHFAFNRQFPPRVTRLSWPRAESDYPGWESYGALLPRYDWEFDDLYPRSHRSPTAHWARKWAAGQVTFKVETAEANTSLRSKSPVAPGAIGRNE